VFRFGMNGSRQKTFIFSWFCRIRRKNFYFLSVLPNLTKKIFIFAGFVGFDKKRFCFLSLLPNSVKKTFKPNLKKAESTA